MKNYESEAHARWGNTDACRVCSGCDCRLHKIKYEPISQKST